MGAGTVVPGLLDITGGAINYGLTRNQSYDQLSLDPRIKDLQAQQVQQAQDFQNNLPGYQNELYNQADNSARNSMAQKLADVKSASNSRGLLYSGLKQGQESAVGGQTAADLSNQRAKINEQTQGISNQMNQNAIGSGLAMQRAQQQMADQNYQMASQQAKQKQEAAQGLIGGIGKTIGGIF